MATRPINSGPVKVATSSPGQSHQTMTSASAAASEAAPSDKSKWLVTEQRRCMSVPPAPIDPPAGGDFGRPRTPEEEYILVRAGGSTKLLQTLSELAGGTIGELDVRLGHDQSATFRAWKRDFQTGGTYGLPVEHVVSQAELSELWAAMTEPRPA